MLRGLPVGTAIMVLILSGVNLRSEQIGGIGVGIAPPRVDIPSDAVLQTEQPGGVGSLAFSPKADLLVSGTKGGVANSVKLWELTAPATFQTLTGGEDYAISLA